MSSHRDQDALEGLSYPTVLLDRAGRIVTANTAFAQSLQAPNMASNSQPSPADLKGVSFASLNWFEGRSDAESKLAVALESSEATREEPKHRRAIETDFEALVDASPAMIWMTDADSRCVYLSKQWYEFTGRTPEQDLGFGWLENIHPDDLAETSRVYSNAVSNLGAIKVDYRLRHKSGRYSWSVDVGYPRFDQTGKFLGYIGTVTDIHDRIAVQNELEVASRRLERSAEATDLGIWYCDLPFDELTWNKQVKNHFWLPPDAYVTIGTFYERIHPDDREPTRIAIENSNLKKAHYDIVYRTTNPADETQVKYIRAVGWTDFDAAGNPRRFDGLTLDITEDRKFRAELEHAKNAAEAANQAKTEFLANMSHEIRTPLGVILGFSELLRDSNVGSQDKESYFETIARNGRSLTRIIDDILDLAKVESGKIEIERIDISLYELMRETVDLFRERAREKGIYLLLNIHEDVPDQVCTDPTRLRQVMLNLVGNAIKFTDEGGVRVRVSCDSIANETAKISIAIEDTGVGIEEKKRARLFKPFAQADTSTTRKFGGTGLGLALSDRLARALGGGIRIASSNTIRTEMQPTGSTFVFEFEAFLSKSKTLVQLVPLKPIEPLGASDSEKKPLSNYRILVADDSPDNRVLVSRLLSKMGAIVSLATNGREAVSLARDTAFTAILMDIQMPEMDGYDATRMLRSAGYSHPIIALTAHALPEDVVRTREVGCDAHLTKPIDSNQLLSTLRSLSANFTITA